MFHAKKTLEVKGSKTIQVHASTRDTKRVTVAATVTTSGKMLPQFMIFKGAPNEYACQKKAWMEEDKCTPGSMLS